ncbi:TIGR03943 family putative permease subunit [Actinophytocola algeriensis]|uniref:Putative repeat protein (TIGR03943 family) n=1 Tax=Actinophytocola algeriensis TaxID=1768010 RepID=A0A7W7Q6X8_9PSEU|nr:TIGR03943 family protein [Actinophytocola algeriensis]MBB4908196.1 putative repeat protein (TIGR03943 family) [Actinophytocola algeriensis]MBE1480226.1 putative repeat protein (TIGR03943 family) [Actinophytocola algeriensis]
MRRETQNILLVLLGGALLKISFSGTYLRYVKPSHQWLLITGGVIMILLAAVSIVRELRGNRDLDSDHGPDDDHGHSHSARSAWLLVLPVLAVFLIGPPPLGSDSVERAAGNRPEVPSTEGEGSTVFPALPAGDPVAVTLSEFSSRAAWDRGHSLDDRTARLMGFVVQEGDDTYVARLAIGCCAADAFPVKVKLLGRELSHLADDSWIEVDATLRPGSATRDNSYVPSVTVHTVRGIPEPEDPYEH